jgi:hypothetical protein
MVDYDSVQQVEITEEKYREAGHQPELDTLPWKKDEGATKT